MKAFLLLFCFASSLLTQPAAAQTEVDPFHLTTPAELAKQGSELLRQAADSDSGSTSVTLEKFANHYTMLSARVKSGEPEIHQGWSEIIFVLDGEGKEIVGGKLTAGKVSGSAGELTGTGITGGNEYELHPGDMLHLSAGTPHQQLVAESKTLVCYIIRIAGKQ